MQAGALAEPPVTVLQLVAGAVLLGAGYLVLARSGNQSDIAPSAFELALRSHLTTLLQVRPRFKEFVVGFPALMLLPALVAGRPRALGLAVRAGDRRRAGRRGRHVLAPAHGAGRLGCCGWSTAR